MGVLGPRYENHDRWFSFPSPAEPAGTWFDATLQRTERYGLYSVPHLRSRLLRLYVFDSNAELGRAVAPFVADMALRRQICPDGQVTQSIAEEVMELGDKSPVGREELGAVVEGHREN